MDRQMDRHIELRRMGTVENPEVLEVPVPASCEKRRVGANKWERSPEEGHDVFYVQLGTDENPVPDHEAVVRELDQDRHRPRVLRFEQALGGKDQVVRQVPEFQVRLAHGGGNTAVVYENVDIYEAKDFIVISAPV